MPNEGSPHTRRSTGRPHAAAISAHVTCRQSSSHSRCRRAQTLPCAAACARSMLTHTRAQTMLCLCLMPASALPLSDVSVERAMLGVASLGLRVCVCVLECVCVSAPLKVVVRLRP